MNIFSIIFIYINIQYTFSLGSRDFFGAAPGLKLPRLPCVPLQCRCFPWPPVYGFDGDAARWPPGFAPQWFTGSQSSQRQLYGCNISWAQPREISATIHQFDPQKIRVCNKNNNFQNDQTIWRFKNSNFQHVRISGLCRSRGLLPNLSSMSCILERSSWKQLMASRVLKKRMIGWYSKISKISIGNAGWFSALRPQNNWNGHASDNHGEHIHRAAPGGCTGRDTKLRPLNFWTRPIKASNAGYPWVSSQTSRRWNLWNSALAMFPSAPMPGESCHLPHWLRIEGFPSPWVAWFSELICNNLESVTIVQVEGLFRKHYNNLYNQNSHGPDPQSKWKFPLKSNVPSNDLNFIPRETDELNFIQQ